MTAGAGNVSRSFKSIQSGVSLFSSSRRDAGRATHRQLRALNSSDPITRPSLISTAAMVLRQNTHLARTLAT